MPFQRLRRALLTAACVAPLLLAACGGGSVESKFSPTRMVAFGDASADAGQRGARYTVNNGGTTWTEQVASRFGLALTPSAAGGTGYAIGSARVSAKPDAGGNAATPTVTEQIDAFLVAGAPGSGDLIVVSAGAADIIAESAALGGGGQDATQTIANVRQAAIALAAQVRRLVNAGAKHVLVTGPYNLGRSPWNLQAVGGRDTCETREGERPPPDASPACLSSVFNQRLLIEMSNAGLGARSVLYVDAALFFNLVTSNPATYGYTDVTNPLCTSVDPGPGIGIGAGQVNSALCNAGTLSGGPVGTTLFADRVYFTPAGHASFGSYAFDRLRENW
ncbi:SGNH/GDSL hydrolase family protein [Ramlibacter tataouinensis]|uniref:SGNH/GDSL hydrolase family protein n=1 Tax=Ramlibacter tataouinensis TaxID=94132 RepID=UPI0022F405EB|nr:SGNH/GDSL hydrolase family protein [Ramlibacter tataouinensis]WBY00157.1 SGNH/GDSL hydrolase family protein [Ramlibacter tataouinensis]